MAVIISRFQICDFISLGCLNLPFVITAKIIRRSLLAIIINHYNFLLQYFKNSLNTRLSLVYVETWQQNFTPFHMAVIFGHFQTCNFISLGCFNWPFVITTKIIRMSLLTINYYKICFFCYSISKIALIQGFPWSMWRLGKKTTRHLGSLDRETSNKQWKTSATMQEESSTVLTKTRHNY